MRGCLMTSSEAPGAARLAENAAGAVCPGPADAADTEPPGECLTPPGACAHPSRPGGPHRSPAYARRGARPSVHATPGVTVPAPGSPAAPLCVRCRGHSTAPRAQPRCRPLAPGRASGDRAFGGKCARLARSGPRSVGRWEARRGARGSAGPWPGENAGRAGAARRAAT